MNTMNQEVPQDLRTRTSDFALRIIRLYVSSAQKVEPLIKEINELIAIFVTIVKKVRTRLKKR